MQDGFNASPINPLPPAIWLVLLPIVVTEVALGLGSTGFSGDPSAIGWRGEAVERFALSSQMLPYMLETGRWMPDYLLRFLTYSFVHASPMHALMAGVFILALGKFVAEVFSAWAFLAVFFGAAIGGAVVYSLVPGIHGTLLGGYPAAYGLIGAFTFVLWARLGAANANRARAFALIGFLLLVQLVFGLLFGGGPDWIADFAGFAVGFGLSFLLVPGGPAQLLRRIRQR